MDGRYTLSNVSPSGVLVFSYIGYKNQEVACDGRRTINVTLSEDSQSLDEVIVVGYGSLSRKELSSSIVQVDRSQFQQGAVNNPMEMLTGRVAGLNVNNTGLYAQYIMLPVKVSEPTTLPFSFSITLEGETNARTYNASIAIPSNELIAGNSYLFTVTFVNNEITFNSTVNIINWVEVSGGKPVVPIQTN